MRMHTLVLASILTSCLIAPAVAEEMKPASPFVDVQKRQDMHLQLQMMHQRQMNEIHQLQQRHMREVDEQNMKHMQEMQSMHQQARSF